MSFFLFSNAFLPKPRILRSLIWIAFAVVLGFSCTPEKSLIKERQKKEGIRLRQAKGLYMGRRINTKDTPEHHLKKERSRKILEYLKKGTRTAREVAAILNTSIATITKPKKIAKELGVIV